MFFYQALIMLLILTAICVVTYGIKIRNRAVLAALILLFAVCGAGALLYVQNFFGTHFYTQKIARQQLEELRLSENASGNLAQAPVGYRQIDGGDVSARQAFAKTYQMHGNGTDSKIEARIYVFDSKVEADQYFALTQKFYENRDYLPPSELQSSKEKTLAHKYVVSYIKSVYLDYSDLIYLPSKITYLSSVTVQDGNAVVCLNETAGRPVTNKAAVLGQLSGETAGR